MSQSPERLRVNNTAEIACTGKAGFVSFKLANEILSRQKKMANAPRSAYHCHHCRQWHIGNENARTGKALKAIYA